MDVGASAWLVILLALVLANLPFFNDKVFGLIPLKGGQDGQGRRRKHFVVRLIEMTVLYFAVGLVGLALEGRIGTVFPQTWELYAISACAFLVFAFPGFTARYLRKQH